jgi:RNA polymerase-interacting CarD/CdnL/TRCF family regulator
LGILLSIGDKGLPGQPCSYYVIEGKGQTLWVPVEEKGSSSLHRPTSRADFKLLTNILRSQGEKMSNNPYRRRDQLDERVRKASPKEVCLVIRDLTNRSRSRKLSSNDVRVLNHAKSYLLDEWERTLGTAREKARYEMEGILKETPARQNHL